MSNHKIIDHGLAQLKGVIHVRTTPSFVTVKLLEIRSLYGNLVLQKTKVT